MRLVTHEGDDHDEDGCRYSLDLLAVFCLESFPRRRACSIISRREPRLAYYEVRNAGFDSDQSSELQKHRRGGCNDAQTI